MLINIVIVKCYDLILSGWSCDYCIVCLVSVLGWFDVYVLLVSKGIFRKMGEFVDR